MQNSSDILTETVTQESSQTTSPEGEAKPIPKIKARFYHPIGDIVSQIGDAFNQAGEVIELKGFPLRVYCFRHPDHVAALLRHPNVGMTKYPSMMPRVQYLMGGGGYILKGGEEWKAKRRMVQEAFKGKCLHQYAAMVPAITQSLIEHWQARAAKESNFDICRDLQALITHISLNMFLSKDFSPNDNPIDSPIVEQIRQQTHFIELRLAKPLPLWLPTPDNLKFRSAYRQLNGTFLDIVAERRAQDSSTADVISILLNATDDNGQAALSDQGIVDELFSIYFGASVMATTISWCLHAIATTPQVQQKLAKELSDVLGANTLTPQDMPKLPYNNQVMLEIARLFPPSWGYPRHCEEPLDIDGYRIPAGSIVIPMVYHSHRHPDYWDQPEAFSPERFAPENRANIDRFAHYPFGGGARTCLGANLAPMVLQPIIAMLIQRFEFEFKPRFNGDPIADFGFEIHPQGKVMMALHPRGQ